MFTNFSITSSRIVSLNHVKLNSAMHQSQTRKFDDIHVPFMKIVICRQSIHYNDAKIWNDIPVEIRHSHNLTSFRTKQKNISLANTDSLPPSTERCPVDHGRFALF